MYKSPKLKSCAFAQFGNSSGAKMKNQFDLCWFLGQNFIASGSHVSLVVLMRKVDDNLMMMIILHTFTRILRLATSIISSIVLCSHSLRRNNSSLKSKRSNVVMTFLALRVESCNV